MFSCLPISETTPDLSIEWDDPIKIYKPGETINCTVVMTNKNKFIEFKNLKVRIYGKGKTSWHQGRVMYSEKETYFLQEIFLVGNDTDTISQPFGIFRYHFSYTLPVGIPTSCYHEYGSISYHVKAIMTRSICTCNPKIKKPFLVNGSTTYLPNEVSIPAHVQKIKHFPSFLRCGMDKIFFLLETNFSGMVPGDFINFQLTVENNSVFELHQNVTLVQIMKFKANGSSRREHSEVMKMKGDIIPQREKQVWTGSLQIPRKVLLTGLDGSKLINVRHVLKAQIKAPFLCAYFSSSLELPLTIGSPNGKQAK
ncbi:arrestin domain-containing protein 2 [Folsomia candida]|uniref:arrestin domain-containing protein 2 n=1 Tax=Folsomia candida TaxID=158441 RepID=UPI001604A7FA|nr:arrestin domain-containing protein 2 [Folsomia candida]